MPFTIRCDLKSWVGGLEKFVLLELFVDCGDHFSTEKHVVCSRVRELVVSSHGFLLFCSVLANSSLPSFRKVVILFRIFFGSIWNRCMFGSGSLLKITLYSRNYELWPSFQGNLEEVKKIIKLIFFRYHFM